MFRNKLCTKYCTLFQCYTLWLYRAFPNQILLTAQRATLNFWWEFCFIGIERLDWVEERVCSRFMTGVKRFILGDVIYIYIYIMTVNYMILNSVNTSHIELYLLNYSIIYSVEYTQYNTVTYFSHSTIICFFTVHIWLWHRAVWCIFNKLPHPFSGY